MIDSAERLAVRWAMGLAFAGCVSCRATKATPSPTTNDPLVRVLETGAVRGAHVGGVYAFRGIPYAAAPIGPRRWRAPSSHEAWSDVRAATTFGPSCVQRSLTEATVL